MYRRILGVVSKRSYLSSHTLQKNNSVIEKYAYFSHAIVSANLPSMSYVLRTMYYARSRMESLEQTELKFAQRKKRELSAERAARSTRSQQCQSYAITHSYTQLYNATPRIVYE